MNVNYHVAIFSMLFLGACSNHSPVAPPTAATGFVPTLIEAPVFDAKDKAVAAPVVLDFVDLDAFDTQLSDALANNPTAVVDVHFIGLVTVSQVPPRMQKWMAAVDSVDLEPKPRKTRGLFAVFSLLTVYPDLMEAVDKIKSWLKYRPARDHDAIIHYDPDTGAVKKVSFLTNKS